MDWTMVSAVANTLYTISLFKKVIRSRNSFELKKNSRCLRKSNGLLFAYENLSSIAEASGHPVM